MNNKLLIGCAGLLGSAAVALIVYDPPASTLVDRHDLTIDRDAKSSAQRTFRQEGFSSRGQTKSSRKESARRTPAKSLDAVYPLTISGDPSPEARESLSQLRDHSLNRLRRLGHHLNLSEEQKRQAYPLLVRSSPQYRNNNQIALGGAFPSSLSPQKAESEIYDFLDFDQQEELIESSMAEREWWDELLVDLETELDHEVTLATEESLQPSEPLQEEEQASFNLFENLGQ